MPPMPSIHRLGRGLPGYLIPFATHAFVHECQDRSSTLPSPLVFLPISTHFTTTPAVPYASPNLEPYSIRSGFPIRSEDLTPNLYGNLRTLYAQ